MIKGLPSVDFKPHDDLILDLLDDRGKHVNHIVMATGTEKWFLQFDYVNMGKPATIYFDISDAIVFKQKLELCTKTFGTHNPANLENVLSGTQYPKTREGLVEYVSQKRSTVDEDLFDLIKSLANRTYRDSAEVAVAFGELKSGKGFKSAKQAEVAEQPSKKGGKAAARESVSAAAVTAVTAQ